MEHKPTKKFTFLHLLSGSFSHLSALLLQPNFPSLFFPVSSFFPPSFLLPTGQVPLPHLSLSSLPLSFLGPFSSSILFLLCVRHILTSRLAHAPPLPFSLTSPSFPFFKSLCHRPPLPPPNLLSAGPWLLSQGILEHGIRHLWPLIAPHTLGDSHSHKYFLAEIFSSFTLEEIIPF